MDDKTPDMYKIGKTPEELQAAIKMLRADFDAHNHADGNSKAFQTIVGETLSVRAMLIRKTSYTDTTAGFWSGLVGNTVKLNVGDATNYLKWTGSALQIAGDISGGSININNNAIIDSSGNATFIGVTSLNIKAYTNFENSGRFILTGDVAPTFGNQGMTVAPGTTANHYARCLWWITNYLFNNNPTFTCSMLALGGFQTGDGVAYIGLGNPTISGTGFTETGTNHCGFEFKKTSGTTTITLVQCDGSGNVDFVNNWLTVSNSDSIELYLKMKSTGIEYRYRKNGGAISAATTLSNYMPSGSEQYISFKSSNKNTTDDFQLQIQCAAYEH